MTIMNVLTINKFNQNLYFAREAVSKNNQCFSFNIIPLVMYLFPFFLNFHKTTPATTNKAAANRTPVVAATGTIHLCVASAGDR